MKLLRILPVLLCSAVASANATERSFAYTYEATTLAKGAFELENTVTWKHAHEFNQFDFRHEVEFGITDRLQMSLYLANWSVKDGDGNDKRARYNSSSVEMIYNLTNPVTDLIGSAVYGEVTYGDRLLELEGKIILQKNFGPWIVAYNAGLEAEFEGAHLDERTGEFAHSIGISYQVRPQLSLGVEALHEIEWPEWGKPEDSRVFFGPNVSTRFGRFFATLTPLIQLTDIDGEPRVETRLVFGCHF